MALRYWVGGTADWNATAGTKWSTTSGGAGGSAVPTAADDVIFDANSGAAVVTVGSTVACRSLNCAAFTGNLRVSNPINIGTTSSNGTAIFLNSGMSFSSTGGAINLISTSSTQQVINTAGKSIDSLTIDGAGSSYLLSSTLSVTSMAFKAGTLDTGNYNMNITTFAFSTAGTKSFLLGLSTLTVGSWTNSGSNLTVTPGTSLITGCTTFQGAGLTYNNLTVTTTLIVTGSNTFNVITINASKTLKLTAGTTTTVYDINTSTGAVITSDTAATHTIYKVNGVLSLHNTTISYSVTDGEAKFYALTSASNVDGGNNTGWIFDEPTTAELLGTKTYQYKWYTGTTYNGLVKPITSDFNLSTQINTPASQLSFTVGAAFQEVGATTVEDNLIDDASEEIVDDLYFDVLTEREYTLTTVPTIGDKIVVYEYSPIYPDGKQMFTGRITRWDTSYKSNTITYTALSYGIELSNYLVSILSDSSITSYTNFDATQVLYSQNKVHVSRVIAAAQTFQIAADADISKIILKIGNTGAFSVDTYLDLYQGTPSSPGVYIATVNRTIPPQSATDTEYIFTTPKALTGSTDYFFKIGNDVFGSGSTNTVTVSYDSTASTYPSGAMYTYNESTGWSGAANDMYFNIVTSSGATANVYTDQDPSAIIRDALDTFVALGGSITYTADSIADTGTTVSYTFKFNTYMDLIQKCVELAPAYWYYYVDPATNILYFQPKGTAADHTMTLKKHFADLSINYVMEDIKNSIYFTGGDDGTGTNVLVSTFNDASIAKYGSWLDLPNDSRVTTTTQANTLANSMLNEYSKPKFQISFDVPSPVYDITTFVVGDMIAFTNMNDFMSSLLLQVQSVDYRSDIVTIRLDQLPSTQIKYIDNLRRNLLATNTQNNPGTL